MADGSGGGSELNEGEGRGGIKCVYMKVVRCSPRVRSKQQVVGRCSNNCIYSLALPPFSTSTSSIILRTPSTQFFCT